MEFQICMLVLNLISQQLSRSDIGGEYREALNAAKVAIGRLLPYF